MSSILKALKKLEQEKSGRFPDSLKINSDILITADYPRRFSPFVISLLLLLVFGGGAAVAVFFMKEKTAPQATTAVSQAMTVKSVVPTPPQPIQGKPETLPAEIVVVPSRTGTSGVMPRKQQKKPAATDNSAGTSVNKPIRAVEAERPVTTLDLKGAALPAASDVPVLRVNGIAYQNSAADSMAIINGTPVSSGSVIEGITVEEVRKDRVLFQRNGEKFEIQLGQSNR